jgi:NAD(P)-dependent dehydrogenase (short-subunit alcohol dehydrogenase family)
MKTALITGGAQGIGAAAARRLVSDGFGGILLLDRNADGLRKTRESLKLSAARVELLQADLRNEATAATALQTAISHFGKIDVLVNAAGNTERCGMSDTTAESFTRIFDVNVKAPFFLMQAAAAEMLKSRSGVIVNISSMLAYGGPPNLATYSASKAALNIVTKSAANTWKRSGIRVYAINLGWTATEGEHETQTRFHKLPENWAQEIGARMPFGRLATADDAAGVISFLVSGDAAMMTGTIIDLEQMPAGVFDQHPALCP